MKLRGTVWSALCAVLVVGCGDGYTSPDNTIIIGDNNQMGEPAGSAEVLVGVPSGPLLEGGAAVTVSVSLKRPPTAPVTITLSSSDEAAGTISPASMTFEPGTFAAAQLVTLTPVDDEVATGDKKWELRFELASDDAEFNGKPVTSLKLTTIDNDAAPSIVATVQGEAQTTELGGAATISVQLSKQPKSDVLIPIKISDAAEADLSGQSLTFTTLNWNLAQEIVATGKDDKVKDGDKRYTVIFGAANSADEEFNGIGPAEVALTSIDGVCGNMVVDGAEACEPDGVSECEFGQMGCMVCNNACELVPGDVTGFCGDGVTQRAQGEECDAPFGPCPYGQMSCTVCSPQCKQIPGQVFGFCGDGMVQASDETCDEAEAPCPYGQMSCMTCRSCQRIPGQVTGYCGDGVVQAASGEDCDPMSAQPATCPVGTVGDTACRANTCKFTIPCSKPASTGSGHLHGCAVFESGAVRCWGQVPGRASGAAPALVAGVTTVEQVAGGRLHTCFLLADETVRCVGANLDGQLGDGTEVDRNTPVAVRGLSGVKQIATGAYFSCALLNSGAVKCWGNGYSGQLGQGVYDASSSPVTVAGVSNVVSIAAGDEHACAVQGSGVVRCWGSNSDYALGTNSVVISASAVAVGSLTNAKEVYARGTHSCVVLTTGGVRCWGNNSDAQLGDDTFTNRATPVAVAGLTGVTQLALTQASTCALLASGGVTCWGDNLYGQLGDGSSTPRRTPTTQVSQVSDAVHIASGQDHTCVVLTSGATRCWGKNSFSQLGTGASSSRSTTPVPVAF
jgi:alpha-tubulin suppressor-like RCC1 family protein